MKKGKYISDLYKNIENKSFNVEDAVNFLLKRKEISLMKL